MNHGSRDTADWGIGLQGNGQDGVCVSMVDLVATAVEGTGVGGFGRGGIV